MSRALVYLPGREAVFERVLGQFAQTYRDGLPQLRELLDSGRLAEAGRLLHALRGACAAVGADALRGRAERLERRLQAAAGGADAVAGPSLAGDADWTSLADELRTALRELVQAVQERLPPPPAPAAAVDAAALEPALAGLEQMLVMSDFGAAARLRAIEPQLRALLGDAALRSIEQPLRQYDHERALQALRQWRSQQAAAGAGAQ